MVGIGSKKYSLSEAGNLYYKALQQVIDNTKYPHIVNPCGEISLHTKGGYCVIGDLVPYHADSLDDAIEQAKILTRFLIRTNLMDSLYNAEVKRTNRIGVGLTGIHEFAWMQFGYGFYDLIDEEKSIDFWKFIERKRIAVEEEAKRYSTLLGLEVPHTCTTIKPSGSVSKLYNLTEGAHLPAMRYYLRWVQFQNNDPRLQEYKDKGYPVLPLNSYPNVSIIGFPTLPLISTLGMGDKLVTAREASPEDQYKWLMLLEKYWLGEGNNQISYTIKLNIKNIDFEDFKNTFQKYQSEIRCCSILPTLPDNEIKSLYEYLPEEEVTEEEFINIVRNINDSDMKQEIDLSTLLCAGGACPL